MAEAQIRSVAIRAVVGAVPGQPIEVKCLPSPFSDADKDKVLEGVGLRKLHRVLAGETAGDLCYAAAERLLSSLQWERATVDGIILVTQTPDHVFPATACILQHKLGLPASALAFDISLGCSGYIYALFVASSLIVNGSCKRFLVLAGDTISPLASQEDKGVCLLFGDAGSATALELDRAAEPISFVLGTDGSGATSLCVPAGGFRQRPHAEGFELLPDEDGNRRSAMQMYMDGIAIFHFTGQRVIPLVSDVLRLHGWERDSVDAFVFHQANAYMLRTLAKRMKLDPVKVPINIGKYGNTSSATIPLVLADDLSAKVMSTDPLRALLVGFGVGFSWGAAAVSLQNLAVAEVFETTRPGESA